MKRYLIFIFNFSLFILFVGCASHPMDPTINMKPPKYVEQMPSKVNDIPRNNPGSLFTNSDNLFSDTKARKVNDVITVLISENIKQSVQDSKKLSEVNSDNGGTFDMSVSGGINWRGKTKHIGKTGLTLNLPSMNSTRTFNGSGNQQTNASFQTYITVRIIKVLQNGNYYVQGSREMYLNGQKQIIEVSGVIRPQDISADNTIDSKYIADAKIVYKTEGDIKRATEKNWFAKFWDAIAPW